jgi:hypothetical protein
LKLFETRSPNQHNPPEPPLGEANGKGIKQKASLTEEIKSKVTGGTSIFIDLWF